MTAITTVSMISCQNSNNREKQIEEVKNKPIEVVEIEGMSGTTNLDMSFWEFKSLYEELISFKNKSDFRKFGFAVGGPYNEWLLRVQKIKNNPDSKLLLQKGIVIGDLEQLGLAYVSSKGKETDVTTTLNNVFSAYLSPVIEENAEILSTNSNNINSSKDKNIIGRWTITDSKYPGGAFSYVYEICKKGSEFVGVATGVIAKTEQLEKRGNKYYVRGNDSGEYYIVDANMNMKLFDKYGSLESEGWTAKKLSD
jgi:hypothetical protein